ncbi:MAG: histidinol-phosphatase [Sulfurospirillaceae bacterium]|nr:histidinol-phosphatase [Sulfurospirillaceae bacterium]MDD3462898.1 histidinol-phosphatase [Sulfurospirillaceae bacterium]
MIIDLHNHTSLCNHAEGTIEEFVEKAIELNIDIFGFADHAPMNLDQAYRMNFSQMDTYEKDVLKAKKNYKNNIEVLLGYEVDYLEGYIDESVLKRKVDYFIGSVHFLGKWGFDNPEFIGEYKNKDLDVVWSDYFKAIENMAKTKLFDIVGHIDLIKLFNFMPTKDIRLIAEPAIREIKKADMVVEINSAGIRKPIGEQYPSVAIMEMLAEHDIKITFGSDAHYVNQIGFKQDEMRNLAKQFGYSKCAVFKNRQRKMVDF